MASALLVLSPTAVRGSFSFTFADILRFRYSNNPLHHISSKLPRIDVHARISNYHSFDHDSRVQRTRPDAFPVYGYNGLSQL
jgi:hypothetical protein